MNLEEYKKIVKKNKPNENKTKNAIIAFVTGGMMGVFACLLYLFFYKVLKMSIIESNTCVSLFLILSASILTGLNVFDKAVNIFKAGLIVPITGFAHSMTAPAIDGKDEGIIAGIGGNMFKLAGCVLIYGVISAFIFGLIKGVFL